MSPFSPPTIMRKQKIFIGRLSRHENLLIAEVWRGPVRDKRRLQVVDDTVDHGIVGEESDDFWRK